jgi:P-type Cu2+ transporter
MSLSLPTSPLVAPVVSAPESSATAKEHLADAMWRSFDEEAQWRAFSQRVRQGDWVSHVKVQGMHCSACSAVVEQCLLRVPGVVSAKVDALSSRAQIVWRATEVLPSAWLSAVSHAGYALLPVHGLDAVEQARVERRTMLWRWLVAGFCMMQVMMYAWPYYGAQPGDIDATSDLLLRWASLLLTLPVLIFSSGPFFRAAWNDIKSLRVSMDLPIALGIGLTFLISTVAVVYPSSVWGTELYFDSLTMLVFFLLTGRWLELRLKQAVAGQIELGVGLLPVSAEVEHADGETVTTPVRCLAVGHVIHVRTGETLAADGVVIRGQSETEESVLTGEAMPVAKSVGDQVFAGTTNLSSPLYVKLTHVHEDTRLGQMNQLMQSSLHTKPEIVQLADRVAKPFLIAVILLACAAVAFWWSTDPHRGVLAAIAVLVVTCPCALALAAPTAFLSSASALAKQGLLVRDLKALESLSRTDHFAFDKTGTLTRNTLTVEQVQAQHPYSLAQVTQIAALMSHHSLHPVSRAVDRFIQHQGILLSTSAVASDFREFAGLGVEALISGLEQGTSLRCRLGSTRFCAVPNEMIRPGHRAVYLSVGEQVAGVFYLNESLRPDAVTTVSRIKKFLHQNNPKRESYLSLLSGDTEESVQQTAKQLAWDIARDNLAHDCSAADKLHSLETLRNQGLRVAMVGDGINDAPVLAAADVSFAPAQGAALASVKADFLLTSESLEPVALACEHSGRTMNIVRQNLWWALIYNAFSVPLAFAGVLTPWMAGLGMAASSLVVLLNSLRLQRIGV